MPFSVRDFIGDDRFAVYTGRKYQLQNVYPAATRCTTLGHIFDESKFFTDFNTDLTLRSNHAEAGQENSALYNDREFAVMVCDGMEDNPSQISLVSTANMSALTTSSMGNARVGGDRLCVRSVEQQTDVTGRLLFISGETGSEMRINSSTRYKQNNQKGMHLSVLNSGCALFIQQESQEEKSVTNTLRSGSDAMCRICLAGSSVEQLLRPCGCRGTVAAVHRSCLQRWLAHAASSYCELCRHHFQVARTQKWSFFRGMLEWARADGGRAVAGDAWRAAVLGALSAAFTARALQAADRAMQAGAASGGYDAVVANLLSSFIIAVVGAFNGLLTTWMLIKIQEHQTAWHSWRASTVRVQLLLSQHSGLQLAHERERQRERELHSQSRETLTSSISTSTIVTAFSNTTTGFDANTAIDTPSTVSGILRHSFSFGS